MVYSNSTDYVGLAIGISIFWFLIALYSKPKDNLRLNFYFFGCMLLTYFLSYVFDDNPNQIFALREKSLFSNTVAFLYGATLGTSSGLAINLIRLRLTALK